MGPAVLPPPTPPRCAAALPGWRPPRIVSRPGCGRWSQSCTQGGRGSQAGASRLTAGLLRQAQARTGRRHEWLGAVRYTAGAGLGPPWQAPTEPGQGRGMPSCFDRRAGPQTMAGCVSCDSGAAYPPTRYTATLERSTTSSAGMRARQTRRLVSPAASAAARSVARTDATSTSHHFQHTCALRARCDRRHCNSEVAHAHSKQHRMAT